MNYIVKKIEKHGIEDFRPVSFEITVAQTMTDMGGKEVQIPRSLGVFTKEELQRQIENLQSHIADVQAKLDAIIASEK